MEDVRRPEDGELCGHVAQCAGGWLALTVFGGWLGEHDRRDDAERQVLDDGLAALADRWTLRERTDAGDAVDEIVCIVEANAVEVTVALGYYATPDVPRRTIPVSDVRSGRVELRR